MSSSPARVFIGTPTANGVVSSVFVLALVRLIEHLRGAGVPVTFRIVDGPNLALQRDLLARDFLNSDATHLLLIDRNMTFPAELGSMLLDAARPLVGAIYPQAAPDIERLGTAVESLGFETALAHAHRWEVELLDPELTVAGGLCRVRALGSGFLLIERSCLLAMAKRAGRASYRTPFGHEPVRAFFRTLPDEPVDRAPERTFARRWHDMGGEVWGLVTAQVGPVAEQRYGMPFSRYLGSLPKSNGEDPSVASAEHGGCAERNPDARPFRA